jgi:hypothetical protein
MEGWRRRVTFCAVTSLGLLALACNSVPGDIDSGSGSREASTEDAKARDASPDVRPDVRDASGELGNDPCPGLACEGGICIVTDDVHYCGTCDSDCTALPHIDPMGVSCELGSCIYTCEPGFADCETLGKGCINQFSSDPDNCGTCGHGCSGGACLSSICSPATFFDGTAVGANITDIGTDGSSVAWGNATDDTIDFVETAGGKSIVLSGSTPYPSLNVALSGKVIAYTLYDGTNAYQGSATAGASGSGSVVTTFPGSITSGLSFDKEGDTVFLLEYEAGQITLLACPPTSSGCMSLTSVGSTAAGSDVAVDSTPHHAVFGDVGNGTVVIYDLGTGLATPVPAQPAANWVTTDGTNVYWGSQKSGSPTTNPILSAPLGHPTSVTALLPDSPGPCGGIATDGKLVYFIAGSAVYSVPIGGASAPTTLANVSARHLKYASKELFFDDGTKIYELATP